MSLQSYVLLEKKYLTETIYMETSQLSIIECLSSRGLTAGSRYKVCAVEDWITASSAVMTISQQTNWTAKLPEGCVASRRSITRRKNLPTTNCKLQTNAGFTLVELAIVIVIIGLLVGGVLQGQALVEQSKNRKIISDVSSFNAAFVTFYTKYNSYAGDMANASIYLSGAINGNGDKSIYYLNDEAAQVWRQFAISKIYPNNLTGTGQPYLVDQNVPKSPVNNAGYSIYSMDTASGAWGYTPDTVKNRLTFGRQSINALQNAALNPINTQNIDAKLDDGLPSQGRLISNLGADASGSCISSGVYAMTNDKLACYFTYDLDLQ
jgi:prepilin-type N-terminal cleavage/methylation domain-containing protein